MKCSGSKFVLLTCAALSCASFSHSAVAEPKVNLSVNLKAQVEFSDDLSLETQDENGTDSQTLELKTKLDGSFNEDVSFLLEARGVKNYGEGGSFDSDTGEFSGEDDYLELRQYWVDYHGFDSYKPLSVRLGRQRFREDYGLWWNRDLDAVRLTHDATLFKSFVAIGQNLMEYRTGDGAYNEDDERILRVIGEASWQWKPEQFIEGRAAYQNDHSGLESAGDEVDGDDFDADDADIVWLGVRAKGTITEAVDFIEKPQYRVDVIGMAGTEDSLLTTSSGENRLVTGDEETDLRGWAVDLGLDVPVNVSPSLQPIFHVGYAYGSGDDDASDNDDHNFRQTGLDSNSSHLSGFPSSTDNYGSVLHPDLSNLHIATVGVDVPVTDALDIAGFYHYYALAEAEGSTSVGAIDADVNGEDTDLGHGLDLMFNLDVAEQFNYDPVIVDKINLKTTLGGFRAGDAYGDAQDETALRAKIDLNVRF